MKIPRSTWAVGALLAATGLVALEAQSTLPPTRGVTDPGVVTTRQAITPAGIQTVFDGKVYGITFGATDREMWVLVQDRGGPALYQLDWRDNRIVAQWHFHGTAALQGIAFDRQRQSPLVGLALPTPEGATAGGAVQLLRRDGSNFTPLADRLGEYLAGAPAVASHRAIVPLVHDNALAVLDGAIGIPRRIKTGGVAPFASAISRDGATAWVSHWGGRWPKAGDPTLPTGLAPAADRVVVDEHGVASTGTVARVDLDAGRVTHSVDVGLHPTAMAWDEPRQRLYVANANQDSISIVDTASTHVVDTIALMPFGLGLKGVAPVALCVAPDGRRLYAALGGFNAVAVIDAERRAILGFIPTAWYPNHLSISSDGATLAVATLLGVGSGWQNMPARRYVHAYRGTVAVLPIPDDDQLAGYTTTVAENNRIATARAQLEGAAQRTSTPRVVPARAGDPSLVDHVVYIVKENRTYDQLFGDLPRGNGDPSLVMFGEDVTPNHRKLATEFVLTDNFYATGGNSADGHQWVTQANETSYTLWPGYVGRSYPYDGTDPIAYASSGFLWDAAQRAGRSVRVYGEFAGHLADTDSAGRMRLLDRWQKGEDFSSEWNITAPLTPLNRVLARNYPPFSMAIPDVVRAQIFLKDVGEWRRSGTMPNLVVLQLPGDHTRGVTQNHSTAKAHVADNDLALGQIVDALTKTPFWPKMAIFVVEDDAQNGVDHVDGHRTVALVVSPYARRGSVDSTFYATQSMVKTIELMLGLPALSLFDLIANDMRASFGGAADVRSYDAVQPRQSLLEVNPALSGMRGPLRQAAQASARMRFDVPDAAPTDRLNRILWGSTRGWSVAYPPVRRAVFTPFATDLDDDERESNGATTAQRKR